MEANIKHLMLRSAIVQVTGFRTGFRIIRVSCASASARLRLASITHIDTEGNEAAKRTLTRMFWNAGVCVCNVLRIQSEFLADRH